MAVKTIQYKQNSFHISYEIVNPNAKVDITILHGWGSNKALMKQSFGTFMSGFRHIYIDLPGFGGSTCSIALETEDVARIVELLMVHINASKDIVLGHSFGGKVALLLAPSVLVLVASAGVYVPKSLKVKSKIFLFKTLKTLGLAKFRSLFVAADAKNLSEPMYQTFKNVVNEDYLNLFAQYKGKGLLFWGKQDTATPLSSGKKIAQAIDDSKLEEYEGDHYFFMKNAADISAKIESNFLDTLGKT